MQGFEPYLDALSHLRPERPARILVGEELGEGDLLRTGRPRADVPDEVLHPLDHRRRRQRPSHPQPGRGERLGDAVQGDHPGGGLGTSPTGCAWRAPPKTSAPYT